MRVKSTLERHADLALGRSTVGTGLALIDRKSLRLVQHAPALPACDGGRQSSWRWLLWFRANRLPHLRFDGVVMVAAETEVFVPAITVLDVHLMRSRFSAPGPLAIRPSHGATHWEGPKRFWKSASAVDICPSKALAHL